MRKLRQIGRYFIMTLKTCASHLPFVETFLRAHRHEYRGAFIEFLIVWISSAVPLGVSIFIDYATSASVKAGLSADGEVSWEGIWHRLLLNLNSGEIFIYIISLLGTVAFVLYKYNQTGRRFEDFLAVVLVGGGIALLSAITFGLQRSNVIARKDLVDVAAVVMYGAALLLFFVALLYEQMRSRPPGKALRKQEADLLTELSNYNPNNA